MIESNHCVQKEHIAHISSRSHFPDCCQGPPGAQVTVADLSLSVNGTSPAVRTGRSRTICASSNITASEQRERERARWPELRRLKQKEGVNTEQIMRSAGSPGGIRPAVTHRPVPTLTEPAGINHISFRLIQDQTRDSRELQRTLS